ncbi:glucose-1-phosphate adenylyltransferase [uncultured Clostridium sp.]|uniref:glucose-1-phosphate adenylyltransferase n=1 Tax=uncultured Clostridium sp. TaxID=59620 RepID=UPI00260C2C11|nr:glucose-1-phosphate adenylyltransferase [uncultured Clostridium sp.]
MKNNKEIVAMILAGGQGTRLGYLTEKLAKPAVPYGGRYRLIDFPLSNCVNSGIDTVGVVTQYKPKAIYKHIGNGEAWDLKKVDEAGVSFLPPYTEEDKDNCYTGTANAVFQNIEYIDKYDPEYVLILSGDHIYKMDYTEMLDHHKKTEADATIAVLEVPIEEASRFGIMNTNEDTTIHSFEEKPKEPKSNTASMGIYIFSWKTLKEYLIKDEMLDFSSHDFGKDVIPDMLNTGRKMVAFKFKGYWRDVGTVESLWQANMDLLSNECELSVNDKNDKWKISSANMSEYERCQIGRTAIIKNCILGDECEIDGCIDTSILSSNVKVGKGAIVENSVVLENAVIEPYSIIHNAIIGSGSIVKERTVLVEEGNITVVGAKRIVSTDKDLEKVVIEKMKKKEKKEEIKEERKVVLI